ncbi:hypothetical protein [Microbacterium sp. Marseille-Q6965]|uniref:hypothetical protein n=1 Tax=Microbacterium sp. Marseille-Q6965 TaxID=2965072 RepID=UPI0021B7BDBC|nr:hypothetical protein [Microbacterium sp. Marseille-Q6965]
MSDDVSGRSPQGQGGTPPWPPQQSAEAQGYGHQGAWPAQPVQQGQPQSSGQASSGQPGYGAAQPYGQPGFGPPQQPGHAAPSPDVGARPGAYGASPGGYPTKAPGYGAPAGGYVAQPGGYGAQPPGHGAPGGGRPPRRRVPAWAWWLIGAGALVVVGATVAVVLVITLVLPHTAAQPSGGGQPQAGEGEGYALSDALPDDAQPFWAEPALGSDWTPADDPEDDTFWVNDSTGCYLDIDVYDLLAADEVQGMDDEGATATGVDAYFQDYAGGAESGSYEAGATVALRSATHGPIEFGTYDVEVVDGDTHIMERWYVRSFVAQQMSTVGFYWCDAGAYSGDTADEMLGSMPLH